MTSIRQGKDYFFHLLVRAQGSSRKIAFTCTRQVMWGIVVGSTFISLGIAIGLVIGLGPN